MNSENVEQVDSGSPDPLTYAMDRATIWKCAHQCFTSVGWTAGDEYTVSDVLLLAKFLSGDDVPDGLIESCRDIDHDS